MNKKAIIAGTVLTGAVAAPIALTLTSAANSYVSDPYAVTIALSQPMKTLNKFKASLTSESDAILGTFTTALLKNRPAQKENGGLETALSIPKLEFIFQSTTPQQMDALANRSPGWEKTSEDVLKHIDSPGSFFYQSLTGDLAEKVMPLGSPSNSQGVAFQLRNTARFWNGDRVTAEDFIETIKIALNAKNGVPWAWNIYRTMGLKNAREIWNAQVKDGLSFEQAWAKYPIGIIPQKEIPLEEMATTPEGKAYYAAEYAAGRKRHKQLLYLFDGNIAITFMTSYAINTVSSPTSVRHFAKVGIDNWGTSIDNLMGCGPYKLEYFDLDYKLIANRWNGYWDRTKVLSPQIELRVLPDLATEIQMFKDGNVGTVAFGAAMLPQFFSDPSLKKYIKPTSFAEKLTYVGMNTMPSNPNAKWMMQENFRKAISYSINRSNFLAVIGADNTFPTESWITLNYMKDGNGNGPTHYSMDFKNEQSFLNPSVYTANNHVEEWNHIYKVDDNDPMASVPGGKTTMFTRDESLLSSKEQGKNDKADKIYNPALARRYYEQFKAQNPSFNGVELKWVIPGSQKDPATVIKQDIERNLPGVTLKLVPKPDNVYKQVLAKMEWDLNLDKWTYEYRDPWALYHLVGDKVTQTDEQDEVVRSQLNKNISSSGMSLVDFIAEKISKDESYFAKRFLNNGDAAHTRLMNKIIAQFLRLESTVGSENPQMNSWQSPMDATQRITNYDDRIWDTAPTKANNFMGYKGEFNKYESVFPGASQWGNNLKAFIAKYSSNDQWKNTDYKFRILYPIVEKLIRDSALGIPLSRIQNAFIATRVIGSMNFADSISYYGYLYRADHIPPTNYVLPGKEALTA